MQKVKIIDIEFYAENLKINFLFLFKVQEDGVQNTLARQKLETPKYLTLYCPALDWLMQCLAHQATDDVLQSILQKTSEQCNR